MSKHQITMVLVGGATLFVMQNSAIAQQPGTLTQQPGTIVEMVLKPCLPGVPRNECGVSLKLVQGGATFTTSSGETITLSAANQVVSINGLGAVTQSSQAGSILNFAAAGTSGPTTASIGGGGGGGGGGTVGSLGSNGGNNVGSPPTTTASLTPNPSQGLPALTSGNGASGLSNSVSP
jgi:hypothetical protein